MDLGCSQRTEETRDWSRMADKRSNLTDAGMVPFSNISNDHRLLRAWIRISVALNKKVLRLRNDKRLPRQFSDASMPGNIDREDWELTMDRKKLLPPHKYTAALRQSNGSGIHYKEVRNIMWHRSLAGKQREMKQASHDNVQFAILNRLIKFKMRESQQVHENAATWSVWEAQKIEEMQANVDATHTIVDSSKVRECKPSDYTKGCEICHQILLHPFINSKCRHTSISVWPQYQMHHFHCSSDLKIPQPQFRITVNTIWKYRNQ